MAQTSINTQQVNEKALAEELKQAGEIRRLFLLVVDEFEKHQAFIDKQKIIDAIDKALRAFLYADSQEILHIHQQHLQRLLAAFVQKANGLKLDAIAPMATYLADLRKNIPKLSLVRQQYLVNKTNRWMQTLKTSWIGLDFALLVLTIVLGFGYPALGLAIFVVTLASMGYSTIELAKSSVDYTRPQKNLGARQLTEKQFKEMIPGLDLKVLWQQKTKEDAEWLAAKQRFRLLSCLLGVAGFFCAAAGLVFLAPFNIPLAATIAATIINGLVVVGVISVLTIKVTQEQARIDKVALETKIEMTSTTQLIDIHSAAFIKANKVKSKGPDSTRQIIDAHVAGTVSIPELPENESETDKLPAAPSVSETESLLSHPEPQKKGDH